MSDYGYIKISRKAYLHDPFWNQEREFSKWEAWEDMIQTASWRKQRREIDGCVIMLERGELIASERYLSKRWTWSRGKVRRFLNRLEHDLNRIRLKTDHPADHVGMIITLCNYDTYQSSQNANGPPYEPATDQVRTTHGPPTDQIEGSKGSKGSKNTYTDDFEKAWGLYPKRGGGNPKKTAFKAWKARLLEGVNPEDLIDATRQYAEYMKANGKTGTEYVMQASTFYGPNERWKEEYKAEDVVEPGGFIYKEVKYWEPPPYPDEAEK